MVHALKILPEHFEDIVRGKKRFEIRYNDRKFMAGDYIALNEYGICDHIVMCGQYTGRSIIARIKAVFDYPDYIKQGYVVLQLEADDISCFKILQGGTRIEK